MVVLGLLLILVGAVAIVAAAATADGTVELLGTDVGAVALFFLGVGAAVAVLWGLGLARWGARRSLRHRRESKKLGELSQKLEEREAERREDAAREDRF